MQEIKETYGAESMLFIQGTGRNVGGWLLLLAYSSGSPNWLQGGLRGNSCFHPRLVSMRMTQGDYTVPDCAQFFQERYAHPEFILPQCIMVWGGFTTPTGRVELSSTHLARMGYDPLPSYHELPMSPCSPPELAQEYPLILSTGRRSVLYFHAEHRNIKSLRELEP